MVFTSVVVGVGGDLVQSLVELRAQRVGRNRAANGHLNECRGDAVERRSRLGLRQAEVDFRPGGIGDLALLHVADDADDVHLSETALAHAEGVADRDPGRADTC